MLHVRAAGGWVKLTGWIPVYQAGSPSIDPARFIQQSVRIELVENVNGLLCFDRLSTNGNQVQFVPNQ